MIGKDNFLMAQFYWNFHGAYHIALFKPIGFSCPQGDEGTSHDGFYSLDGFFSSFRYISLRLGLHKLK